MEDNDVDEEEGDEIRDGGGSGGDVGGVVDVVIVVLSHDVLYTG